MAGLDLCGPENSLEEIIAKESKKAKKSFSAFIYQENLGEILEKNKLNLQIKSEDVMNGISKLLHVAAEEYCNAYLKHPDGDYLRDGKKEKTVEELQKKIDLVNWQSARASHKSALPHFPQKDEDPDHFFFIICHAPITNRVQCLAPVLNSSL